MHDTRVAVDGLLAQCAEYKELSARLEHAGRLLARAKLRREPTDELSRSYQHLQNELGQLADDMTFASPIIWMTYKYEAYQKEAQPIQTMADFRLHCSKPGYICTKRFLFVNSQLQKQGLPPLSDKATYADSLDLGQASEALLPLRMDPGFMKMWATYEFFRTGGKVAKWQNYLEQ